MSSATDSTLKTIQFSNDDFSLVDTYGSMIGNRQYSAGYYDYADGRNNSAAFIYKAIKAIGNDVADSVYMNVKRYIDFVTDVDVCKIQSIRSMLKMYGFKYTIFDNIEQIPYELLDLMNVLSINRKYLSHGDELKFTFRNILKTDIFQTNYDETTGTLGDRSAPVRESGVRLNSREIFSNIQYYLDFGDAVSAGSVDPSEIAGIYSRNDDIGKNAYSNGNKYVLSDLCDEDTPSLVLTDPRSNTVMTIGYDRIDFSKQDDRIIHQLSDSEFISVADKEFLGKNLSCYVNVSFSNADVTEDLTVLDDNMYQEFVKNTIRDFIYDKITTKYNAKFRKNREEYEKYIYPDLGSMYFDSAAESKRNTYITPGDDEIVSAKMFNHVPRSFDEAGIVDSIEQGLDSFDNYQGAQLSILLMERERRIAAPKYDAIGVNGNNESKRNQLRYTYYRMKDVVEYAKFVDNYFSGDISALNIYKFDANYHLVEPDTGRHVIRDGIEYDNVNPSDDIDGDMIDVVADCLARFTTYVCRIREKLKIQTQKNYMKGTNLLMIYVINEYLRDYAFNNKDFFEETELLSAVYRNLSGHQFADDNAKSEDQRYLIQIKEFFDKTEYFNISSETSYRAVNWTAVNSRYWEASRGGTPVMQQNGWKLNLADIEDFYGRECGLSSVRGDDIEDFLCSLYELGADSSFMCDVSSVFGEQRIFSSKLEEGTYADEIYPRYTGLSAAYMNFDSYVNHIEYSYPENENVSAQVSNVLDTHVYVNLSNENLSAVSDVYEAHIDDLISISSSVDSLSADYGRFISGEYQFYYKKSECRFCYEDNDVDTGEYMHSYYIGNPVLDDDEMCLYEHLHQLDLYSTADNIRNWGLIDRIENYVSVQFESIYGDLRSDVISRLVDEYGFVDIQSPTLDDEIPYVYDYINQLIEDRKEFLKNQLAALMEQATNLKTQYENLKNTFTTAIANFEDNNPGYNLGDSTVHCIGPGISNKWKEAHSSYVEDSCAEGRKNGNDSSWAIYLTDNNRNKWYRQLKSDADGWGSNALVEMPIDPAYNSNSPLEEQCEAVLAYMRQPTSFAQINDAGQPADGSYTYGLMSEGVVAVCDTVKQGLDDIETAFSNVSTLADTLFGIDTDSYSEPETYGKILHLIADLTELGQTIYDNDDVIKNYKELLKRTIELSADYTPVKTAYDGAFTDSEQQKYLGGFINTGDLTSEQLELLRRYWLKTDSDNLMAIRSKINDFLTQFDGICQDKDELEVAVSEDGVAITFTAGGTYLEQYLENINKALIDDVNAKIAAGMAVINRHKSLIAGYLRTIFSEIYIQLNDIVDFDECVTDKIEYLNFFNREDYIEHRKMFLTYGGEDFCYDPYYNMKNVTHPSYQVHPFLWNFIYKKGPFDTLIETSFGQQVVEELESDLAARKLYDLGYIGRFGQTINTWKNFNKGLTDYSGYHTRYEKSDNVYQGTGVWNEVVDYDGGFYPPALADYRYNWKAAANSVSAKMTAARVYERCAATLTGEISSYFKFDENGVVSAQNVRDAVRPIYATYELSDSVNASMNRFVRNKSNVAEITREDILDALSEGLTETYYGKYCVHLGYSAAQAQFVAKQMTEYKDMISAMTDPVNDVRGVYDIYKYGLDMYGNSYLLYKEYDYTGLEDGDELSYQAKRNTLGEIWIRKNSEPLAFPAFHGEHPQYYITTASNLHIGARRLAEMPENGITYDNDRTRERIMKIDDRMRWFYDFEITQDKQAISYIAFNAKLPNDDKFRRFDLSMVMSGIVQTLYVKSEDIEYLMFEKDNSSDIDYIEFDSDDSLMSHRSGVHLNDKSLKAGVRYPSLAGYYVYDTNMIDFVYVYRKYQFDGAGNIVMTLANEQLASDTETSCTYSQGDTHYDNRPAIFVTALKNGLDMTEMDTVEVSRPDSQGKKVVGGEMCVGYDKNTSQLTLAFMTTLDSQTSSLVKPCPTDHKIDFDANTEGAVIEDPISPEMNSHDIFDTNVTLMKYVRQTRRLKPYSCLDYNMNSDMAYIPQYPGLSGESRVYDTYSGSQFYSLELLGMSKDITPAIGDVNPDPDPYFDYEQILSSTVFGRVYEDYEKSSDKTFQILVVPGINQNMPPDDGKTRPEYTCQTLDGYFQLTYHLYNMHDYSQRDYGNLELLAYNYESMGKNPYYVGKLSDIKGETDFTYDPKPEDDGMLKKNMVGAYGTYGSAGQSTYLDTNYIDGIKRITAEYVDTALGRELVIRFYADDTTTAYVPEGLVRLIVYNTHDFSAFKDFHMMDAYGMVNCKLLSVNMENPDKAFDGWGIYYDQSRYHHDEISDLLRSYYVATDGGKRYLSEIELSAYDMLSDVYVLQGNKRLSFKYDEEVRAALSSNLYYYPTLNVSYPRLVSEYVDSDNQFSDGGGRRELDGLFSEYNMFIVNADDPKDVADSVGRVDVPVIYNDVNDIRVYEDYLSTDADGYGNWTKYGTGDARLFEFAKFVAPEGILSTLTTPAEIPETAWKNRTYDNFVGYCAEMSGLILKKSEELASGYGGEYVTVQVDSGSYDFTDLTKLYVNYRRVREQEDDSIELYFNYFNYLNTPFVKMDEQGRQRIDTIDGTYLKLASGEDGILDIVVQFRYYVAGVLYGLKNVRVLSYRIYNLSDDKPKFLIQRVYKIERDSQKYDPGDPTSMIRINAPDIDLDGKAQTQKFDLDVYVNMQSNADLMANGGFYLDYPSHVITPVTDQQRIGYEIDAAASSAGLLKIVITDPDIESYLVKFRTVKTVSGLRKYAGQRFMLGAAEPSFTSVDGKNVIVEEATSYFGVLQEGKTVLASEDMTSIIDPGETGVNTAIIV